MTASEPADGDRPSSTLTRDRSAPASCPRCGTLARGPFCLRDGALLEPFVLGERYRIEEQLGEGSMAFVFGARHLILGKWVAVKVLRSELAAQRHEAQRFLRGARLAAQLAHESIAAVIDFGRDERWDLHYLVMDRLRGPSLEEVLRREGRLGWRRLVPILLQLARALRAAHELDVVHRDLTPRNVVLEESSGRSDVVKLCDFGLSRSAAGDDRLTSMGRIVGTPAFMAPEQVRGAAEQAPAVDLYALGTIAYQALTGVLPHPAATPVAMIAAKLRDAPAPIPSELGVPAELGRLIEQCLHTEPRARPTAAEAEAVLAQISLHAPDALENTDLVGTTVGSYRVLSLIGVGGMGSVYLAEHPTIGTRVAIKVLLPEVAASPEIVERFVREARASSAIGSPYIPRCFDFGRLADGRAYAVMEYLDGETVAQRLARAGRFSLAETAVLVRQAAAALGEAHAAGLVHRDIKPDNLFLIADRRTGETSIRILDFGIAKPITQAGSAKLTRANAFIGTPAYCAPEQVYGGAIGPAADVYALGATAFEMLSGAAPFDGDLSDIFAAKAATPPSVGARDPTLPSIVSATLARAMAVRTSDRFANMHELTAEVERWVASAPIDAPAPRTRAWPALAAATVVIASIVAASGGLAAWTLSDSEPPRPAAPRAPIRAPAVPAPAPRPPIAIAPLSPDAGAIAAPPIASRVRVRPAPRRPAHEAAAPDAAHRAIIADPFADEAGGGPP